MQKYREVEQGANAAIVIDALRLHLQRHGVPATAS